MSRRRCLIRRRIVLLVLGLFLCAVSLLLFRKKAVPLSPNAEKVRIITKVVYVKEPDIQLQIATVSAQKSLIFEKEYIKFDNMDIRGQDMTPGIRVQSPEHGKAICELYGNPCQGFVYSLDSNKFYPKNGISGGMTPKTGSTVFIKVEFAPRKELKIEPSNNKVEVVEQSPQSTSKCAVLEAARTWSNECRVPELNPFDETIMDLIHPRQPLSCPGKRFTEYRNGLLTLLDSAAKETKIISMSYKAVTRKPHSDWGYVLGEEKKLQPKEGSFKINDEFIQVDITSQEGNFTEYHAQVVPSPDVVSPGSSRAGLPLSVVIIGFDSVSRAQFQRAFPDVYRYMKDELHTVIMKGNTIVGDGTTPALAAILTGKFESELPEARRRYNDTGPVDGWPWVFKEFKTNGYATLYSEDGPKYAAFNYRLHGFTEPPTHHYSRYFWQAAKMSRAYCTQSKPQHLVHFDYIETFFQAYPSKPKFGLAFLSEISHNSLNSVHMAGSDFHRLIERLHTRNFLNNTMLVLMSDHGYRYGKSRFTLQGKLEERLPFLSITLPPWFRKEYPQLVRNLEHNANLLVTPFDLHATLQHIISYPKLPQYLKWGRSFFDVIPESRDCITAGVSEHYCPCVRWQPVDKDHWSIRQSAQTVVAHINSLTSSDSDGAKLCARLELAEVVNGYQKIPNVNMQQYLGAADRHGRVPKFADGPLPIVDCMYQVQLRTVPGNAVFEVSVTHIKDKFEVVGELSRINLYGDQPKCIIDKKPFLRKYCFCKNFQQ